MKLATFDSGVGAKLGVVVGEELAPITRIPGDLKAGDRVRVEIEGLGFLGNLCAPEF